MAVQALAKAGEVIGKKAEAAVKMPESGEFGKSIEDIESSVESKELLSKELLKSEGARPNLDVIKTATIQQLIEENKVKIQEIRNALLKEDEQIEAADDSSEGDPDNENTNEGEESKEDKELTEEEINEKQRAAIKDAWERIKNGEKLSNEELGNLGEMMMDQYYISKGYNPLNKHRVTSLDDKKGGFRTGIDGVYEKTNPDGTKSYVIVDAKYNTSQLSETNDGKQMSDNWIDKRLDDAVGKEKADEIREAAEDNPDSVKHEIYHIDPNVDENGNMHTDTQEVDSEGNKCGDKTIVEYFDENGERVEPPSGTEE